MSQTFIGLGASPAVEQALAAGGITEPFRIQTLVVPDALAGNDVLAKSPTGSGKTLAFAIPIVERISADGAQPSALVLVPTRELALQVADELEKLAPAKGLRVAAVYGGAPVGEQAKAAKGAQILVATPGRLQDLMDRRMIVARGHRDPRARRGRPDARHGLPPAGREDPPPVPRERQTMLFSATLDGEVGELARATRATRAASRPSARARGRRRRHGAHASSRSRTTTSSTA